jgi:FtsP/CotA-like multicopper oxidase with cupredoxin domain
VIFRNDLPIPALLDWRGLDGAVAAEPLTTARPPIPPGGEASFTILLRRAGTLFCDLRLLGDGQALPTRPFPVVVEDSEPIADRDEVFLVEDWRLKPDGVACAPGIEARDASPPIFTVNGQVSPEISLRSHERLRFRFINGCQRQVIALKIEGHEVRVIALDSAPAEPFAARNSALVLAPGSRVDALIDATAAPATACQILLHDGKEAHSLARLSYAGAPVRPAPLPAAPALPDDGLPARLELRGALRVDLALEGREWVMPADLSALTPPAFKANRGRTIVLALSNRAELATTFHLHGHHFRLLDRLDDGWKPFWLDTLAVEPGQTQRIAFSAEFSGRWLLESTRTDWAAPRLVRWFSVE